MTLRLLASLAVACCVAALSGCGGPKITDPTPDEIKAVLDGQSIEMEENTETISADRVGGFTLVEISHNVKETSSCAVVKFDYSGKDSNLKVDGVVTYRWSPTQKMIEPRFETTEANAQ
jgi:uncharacterized protein involved in tellurium resistance